MDPLALVPLHFEQLKELRNGSISYVQIIKRDQTRPPVRPVCRKLGVSKLSEILSEADLYQALVAVAQAQSLKSREGAQMFSHFDDSDNSPMNTERSDLTSEMATARSMDHEYSEYNTLGSSREPLTHRYGERPAIGGGVGLADSKRPLDSYPEYVNLLNCMLSIRTTWGTHKRLDLFAQDFSLVESHLAAAMVYVCEVVGCRHLDPNVPVESVANAVAMYFRVHHLGIRSRPAPARPSPRDGFSQYSSSSSLDPNAAGFNPSQYRPYRPEAGRFVPPVPPQLNYNQEYQYPGQQQQQPYSGGRMPSSRVPSLGLPNTAPNSFMTSPRLPVAQLKAPTSGRFPEEMGRFTPGSEDASRFPLANAASGVFPKPSNAAPSISMSAMAKQKASGVPSPPNSAALPYRQAGSPNTLALGSSGLATSANKGNLLATYQQFWEISFRLFKSVCNESESRFKSIDLLADLSAVVLASAPISPQIALSLDVVSQRSCLDLCAKYEPMEVEPSFEHLNCCVSALTQLAVQACSQAEAGFSLSSEQLSRELVSQVYWYSGEGLSHFSLPDRPSEKVAAALEFSLYNLAREWMSPFGWGEVYEHVRFRLEAMLEVFQPSTAVHLNGSSIIGFSCEKGFVDMTVLLPDVDVLEYETLAKRRDLTRRIKGLEAALAEQLQLDTALNKLHGCIHQIRSSITVQHQEVMKTTFNPAITPDEVTRAKLMSKLHADGELLCKFGERFAGTIQAEVDVARRQRQLRTLLDQLSLLRSQLHDLNTSVEYSKQQAVVALETVLNQFGYTNVQIVRDSTEDSALIFTDEDAPTGRVQGKIMVSKPMHVHSSRLLACYINMDTTGKVMALCAIVKAFVEVHALNEELGSFGWNVIVLHFLLRSRLLPCTQANFGQGSESVANRTMCGDIDVSYYEGVPLASEYINNLAQVSLCDLVVQFFHYFVHDVNVFTSVLTLRNAGEILPKTAWPDHKEICLWRLSVEDPFQHTGSAQPNDLGGALTRAGQARIFRFMRKGLFAFSDLSNISDEADAEDRLRQLFSRATLLPAAVAGGFTEPSSRPVSFALSTSAASVSSSINLKTDSGDSLPQSSNTTVVALTPDLPLSEEGAGPPPGFSTSAGLTAGFDVSSPLEDALLLALPPHSRRYPQVPHISLQETSPSYNRTRPSPREPVPNQSEGSTSTNSIDSTPRVPSDSAAAALQFKSAVGGGPRKQTSEISPPSHNLGFFADLSAGLGFGKAGSETGGAGADSNQARLFDWAESSMYSDATFLGGSLMSSEESK